MILKKLYFPKSAKSHNTYQFTYWFLNLAKKNCLITILYNRKMLVISTFVGKIKLNFHYEKMTKNMWDMLLEKHKNYLEIKL